MSSWLPTDLPETVKVGDLVFVPLTPALLDEDYAAVMRDVPMLRAWSGQDWPTSDFPLEDDLADLERHDREQRERVALTYSVLLDGVVQGCVYVRPLLDALRSRAATIADTMSLAEGDVVVRGWLHDASAVDLIAACMGWLTRPPFTFPRLWWQTNSECPEQLSACDALGFTDVLQFTGTDRDWELRAAPR